MFMMHTLKKSLLLLTATVCCVQASVNAVQQKDHGDTDISFTDAILALSLAAKQADKFTVYEGLPHPFYKKLVEAEIRTKPTVLIDENWFYLPSQAMPAEDRSSLQRLFEVGGFKPWRGVKFCGGFHGDYAVSFESGGSAYLVLLCFGCHETRILRLLQDNPNFQAAPRFRLTVDLTDDGYKELREVFKKYRKELPPMPDPKSKVTPPGPPPVPARFWRGS